MVIKEGLVTNDLSIKFKSWKCLVHSTNDLLATKKSYLKIS